MKSTLAFAWRAVIGCLLLLGAACANACAICAPSDAQNTLMKRLLTADRIVLAQPTGSGRSATAVTSLRGELPVATIEVEGMLPDLPVEQESRRDAHLLLFNAGSGTWWSLGRFSVERRDWLTQALRLASAAPEESEAHSERLEFFARHLEDPQPVIASAAYEEIASQPYESLRRLAPALSPSILGQWVSDVSLQKRWPLYYLLWGFQRSPGISPMIQERLERGAANLEPSVVSAMVAALIEQRGQWALDWTETHLLRLPSVADPHVQATLLALSVHANEGARLTRDDVVAVYERYIAANPHRAGFVASDLGTWGRWEFALSFLDALENSPTQVFASRYAIIFYLLRNPTPEAKAGLERLRSKGLL